MWCVCIHFWKFRNITLKLCVLRWTVLPVHAFSWALFLSLFCWQLGALSPSFPQLCSLSPLLTVGLSISLLRTGGPSISFMLTVGFSISLLLTGGPSISFMLTVGLCISLLPTVGSYISMLTVVPSLSCVQLGPLSPSCSQLCPFSPAYSWALYLPHAHSCALYLLRTVGPAISLMLTVVPSLSCVQLGPRSLYPAHSWALSLFLLLTVGLSLSPPVSLLVTLRFLEAVWIQVFMTCVHCAVLRSRPFFLEEPEPRFFKAPLVQNLAQHKKF